MLINAVTTDAAIRRATKTTLIEALYRGSFAVLRSHRERTRTKADMVAEAIAYRNSRIREAAEAHEDWKKGNPDYHYSADAIA